MNRYNLQFAAGTLAIAVIAALGMLPAPARAWSGQVSCVPSVTTAEIGQTVTWTATIGGGVPPYTITWSGTDGLSGAGNSEQITYVTTGTKTAHLSVTDATKSTVSKDCTASVTVTPFTCPISAAPGRIIVDFPADKLYGPDHLSQAPISVSIPAGSYKVTLTSYDGYIGRATAPVQPHEQWFARVSDSSGTIGDSGVIGDIKDSVLFTSLTQEVNGSSNPLVISRDGTQVTAMHQIGTSDSVFPVCAAFDPVAAPPPPPPSLDGSCSAAFGATQDTATFSASASGGTGTYTYSWTGDDGLSGSGADVTKTYNSAGTKNATVTITSGGQSVSKSCSISIPGDFTPPACPIPAAPGRIIASFDPLKKICSIGRGACGTSLGPVPITLPAGQYTVTLNSYDGYIGRENITQPHEQWYASVQGASGEIAKSGVIDDLPDYVRSASLTEMVNGPGNLLTVPSGATGVIAEHAYPNDTSSANSVFPSCVAFDPVTPPPPSLTGSCDVTPSSANVGDTVLWGATASGGTGTYTYSWTGDDGLSASTATTSLSYASAGTKNGTVTITSGSASITKTCSVDITAAPPPSFDASCTAAPSSVNTGGTVTFTAIPSGGTGFYTYSWSGDDGLTGSATTTTHRYSTTGTKTSTVVVSSGTQSKTVSCTVDVTGGGGGTPLTASCAVSPSSLSTGGTAHWTSQASGGTGTYAYSWNGTNGLSGTAQDVDKTYGTTGTKTGTVTVTSGSSSVTASCSLTVMPPPGCTTNCGGGFNQPTVVLLKKPVVGQVLSAIYLSQVPYTGFGNWYTIALFIIILAIWSASTAYFLRAKLWKRGRQSFSPQGLATAAAEGPRADVSPGPSDIRGEGSPISFDWFSSPMPEQVLPVSESSRATVPASSAAPSVFSPSSRRDGADGDADDEARNGVVDIIAGEAQRNQVVISEDGMRLIADRGGHDAGQTLSLVGAVIASAERQYPREDGWLLLNREKIESALGDVVSRGDAQAPAAPRAAERAPYASSVNQSVPDAAPGMMDASVFVNWIATGDRQAIQYIRKLQQLGTASEFVRNLVLGLDVVYRARLDRDGVEEPVDERLMHAVSGLSNEQLERLISVLLSSIDQSYRSLSLGMKLALLRASKRQ